MLSRALTSLRPLVSYAPCSIVPPAAARNSIPNSRFYSSFVDYKHQGNNFNLNLSHPPKFQLKTLQRSYFSNSQQESTMETKQPGIADLLVCNIPKATAAAQSDSQGELLELYKSGLVINWDLTKVVPSQIEEKAVELVQRLNKVHDQVANATVINHDTILKPLLECKEWMSHEGSIVHFPQQVAVDKDLREASQKATIVLNKASVEVGMRQDVYKQLVKYSKVADLDRLTPELKRALKKLITDRERLGLHLSKEVQYEVKELTNELNELEQKFGTNLTEQKWETWFTLEQLDGMKPDFLESLEKDPSTGKVKVTLEYPHLFPITKYCRIPETRRRMETANSSKCLKENTELLEKIVQLRHKKANLLGFPTFAAYVQDPEMAKSPETVNKFLVDLRAKLQPLWEKEKSMMLELKKEECKKLGYEWTERLEPWDTRYYMTRLEESQYSVDQEALRAYFPLQKVVDGTLEIYQRFFEIKFIELFSKNVWHEDVKSYVVLNNDGRKLGYFFLDLHPREGKYGHACCIPIQIGFGSTDKNNRQDAAVAMICNFTKPTKEKPSLLEHQEVETFFHEFGHVMHGILSESETAMFTGLAVERDFIEAPSQMLENWVWEKAPLDILAAHYETGEKIPEELVQKLKESRMCCSGIMNLRQVSLALFDQRIHSSERSCTRCVYAEVSKETTGMDVIAGTNFAASFNHLAKGYSARYYSYLWSEVLSMDMFAQMIGDGEDSLALLDPKVGQKYRQSVLQPGSSFDGNVLFERLMGRRDPSPTPFLKSKGLSTDD